MKAIRIVAAVPLVLAVLAACSSGSNGLKDAQAACSAVSIWKSPTPGVIVVPAGDISNVLYTVQQDADKAAAANHQWQMLANDAQMLKTASVLGQPSVPTSGLAVANQALGRAIQQIESDCSHVQ